MAATDEQQEEPKKLGRPRGTGTSQRRVNRVEVNDEGVRVLVEIEGIPAIRAASIMQTVLDLTFKPLESAFHAEQTRDQEVRHAE